MKKLLLILCIVTVYGLNNSKAQLISTIGGTGTPGFNGDGITAITAELNYVGGVAVDDSGNVYIADYSNQRIRKIEHGTGIISTIAGTGTGGYNGDNILATSAEVNGPFGVAVDTTGNVYIADAFNNRIRKITYSTGMISTIAGTGVSGYNGDGILATTAQVAIPFGVSVDDTNNVYISDLNNNRIRKITVSTGYITTIAGTAVQGYNGDGIDATTAELNGPTHVAFDANGNVYIADYHNNRVRKITKSTGLISTIAGNGTQGYNGDGIDATTAELNQPSELAVDAAGNVYVTDYGNFRVRKIAVSNGYISTYAGTGVQGYNGDGIAATTAELNFPYGLAIDNFGNIYIGDQENNRVREVSACAPPAMPGPINGPVSVCHGAVATYSISSVTGATSYTWILPNGWTGSSTTTSITVTTDLSGMITVTANDSCGNSVAQTLYVTVVFAPPVITIIGNDTVCQGSTQIYYTSPQSSQGTTFTWTMPGTWSGSSTSDSISTIAGATGGVISVIAQNACGSSSATLQVTALHTPLINNIVGQNPVCAGSVVIYHANPNNGTGMNYSWILPNGWTGNSSTDSINTTVGTTGGYIFITESNQCGTRTDSLHIIVDTAPPPPGNIIGNDTVCAGSVQTYSIQTVNGATSYTWALPAGWTGSSTTNSITITVGSTTGTFTISVTANNACGSSGSSILQVTVIATPPTSGPITGNTIVAINSIQTYSIASVANATSYQWTVPLNWIINSGQGTTSINVTVGSDTGHVCVTASNSCGISPQRCITIQMVTGINEIIINGAITVYPNPNDGNFTITQSGMRNYELGIYDVMGRQVYYQLINNSSPITINISYLSNGIYFWKAISDKGIIEKGKIVINK